MGSFVKNQLIVSTLFTGFVMGKGYNLKELEINGDKDVIAVLYHDFEEKLKNFKEK